LPNEPWARLLNWVALDKSEGVVKGHFSLAMLCGCVVARVVEEKAQRDSPKTPHREPTGVHRLASKKLF
jgi:hypothetical protein